MATFKLNFPVCCEDPAYLKDFPCPHCNRFISEQDISKSNYNLWLSNEVKEITKEENFYGLGDGKPAYELNFRLRVVGHRDCPKNLKGSNN